MYINKIEIEKYKIFEDINIDFQIPKDSKLENGNIVNVIAGVNGCGKTTLLELFYRGFKVSDFSNKENFKITVNDNIVFDKATTVIEKIENDNTFYIKNELQDILKENMEIERLIYIPMASKLDYQSTQKIKRPLGFYKDMIFKVDINSILGNAELFIQQFIINNERQNNKSNPQERTEDAVNSFNSIFKDCDFITKLIDLENVENRPVFQTVNGDKITIDKLSSGEQQLYARVVSLMILNPENSIILIDEPEISLHPKWQTEIMKIYANIGKNNQFIITTHSPFIISQTYYKNLTFLVKENNKIIKKQFSQPPNNRDINTMIETMGANYELPELQDLHRDYKKLVKSKNEENENGIKLKNEILEYENINSKFFQSINFLKKLRK